MSRLEQIVSDPTVCLAHTVHCEVCHPAEIIPERLASGNTAVAVR